MVTEVRPPAVAEELLRDGAMSVAEASEFSDLGKSKLYIEMDAGRLPYIKLGRRRLIPRRALLMFLASGLRGGWASGDGPGT